MSDYLASLAARIATAETSAGTAALGAGRLRPRLPSLFEPLAPAGAGLPGMGPSGLEGSDLLEIQAETGAPRPPAGTRPAGLFAPGFQGQMPHASAALAGETTDRQPAETGFSFDRPRPSVPAGEPFQPAQGWSGPAAPPRRAGPAVEQAGGQTLMPQIPRPLEPGSRNEPRRAPAAGEFQPVLPEKTGAGPAAPGLPAPVRPARFTPQAHTRAADRPAASEAAPQPEEVSIHIHIGRIELRLAASPQTAPAAPRSPARTPAPSLDDYLHRRSRGDLK